MGLYEVWMFIEVLARVCRVPVDFWWAYLFVQLIRLKVKILLYVALYRLGGSRDPFIACLHKTIYIYTCTSLSHSLSLSLSL